jgi:fructokinase
VIRIGFDVGGSKIAALALDERGAELGRDRCPVPRDYRGTLDVLTGMSEALAQAHGGPEMAHSVGIAIPGMISAAGGLVRVVNLPWLAGMPLRADLQRAIGRPVAIANDANCFALSEAADGAGAGASVVFAVILGTGVGGGIVVGGNLVEGANHIAGEWGHNPLPWPRDEERPGPPCYCGQHGCIETFLSGPGLARDHAAHSGASLDAHVIAAAAAAGDRAAAGAMARYADRLARALATIINVIDPEVIVLGGGLSNIAALYREVPARWGGYVFSDEVHTRLLPARHGDSSGVRGAARLG